MEAITVVIENLPFLLLGAWDTLKLTFFSVLIGLVLGTFIGMGRLSKIKAINIPSTVYVEFLRGTPLLVQISIVYFGLPQLGIQLEAYPAAIVALGLNSGAYIAEIVRAGIQSIPKGQYEAARSLGMTHFQTMRYIILPQAFKNILPALGNEFITLTKDSSLASIIGVTELMRRGQFVITRTFQTFSIYFGIALIYFVMTFTISRLVRFAEKRMEIS
ncbi:nickel transporter [Thermosipho melanesiensis]|uniref:Ectoine/hydroxyectoine ABC transporter, permease protein EhuC n=2 Tax=Thermosipho melanesiensis TaxID=46541 RepID=A6LK85_THEM4|nr:amino acid ABC transporter permease [Thermosipho melanesiensis]ABR30336.1 Ectoine/hydroxyectoine ABC transporter, permease protein EhuC [Thermosipho melanesiensis BI429]APT73502.1 nickel transporter [Thermosipho melanesiensis]OOC37452.1 nickel transporter [Thermosipho melanesiensis]OOC39657.1 nickel transporter [Thermosipho melanesiensis]OOC39686.1 nickel transporter [Thermosipho melanesiensis]